MAILNNYKIKKMSLEDLDSIKDVLYSDFDDFWSYNIFKQELFSEFSHFFVVTDLDGMVLGFAGVQFVLDEADVTNIVVRKSCRHMGLGSLLLQTLIDFCKESSMKSISLEVNEHNSFAIKLYKKFGFLSSGNRANYYNGNEKAVIMHLAL